MNEYELSQNPQLSSFIVRDLNIEPVLPFEDASFDKVTCVVSVDYLNKPKEIFNEIGRVLRPGGECMLAMSNRYVPFFSVWLPALCVYIYNIYQCAKSRGCCPCRLTFTLYGCWSICRCFPTKAFQIWLQTNDLEHIFIAGSFFHYSGLFDPPSCDDISPAPGRSDPMYIVKAKRKSN